MPARRVDLDTAREAEQAMASIAPAGAMPAEVLTRLKGLPALLRTSGLPATLALFAAKSGTDPLGRAYRSVRTALVTQLAAEVGWDSTPQDLYGALAALPATDLGRAQLRLVAFAGWLRRLAEAEEHTQRARRATEHPPAQTTAADAATATGGDGG
ncbi:hypothetical protein AWW66_26610 [Micromonospora rosaria]|uniref:CRISPR type III-B/RAMP module-associated protein Cmr5 n=1 Tax=Micromonospora rosaria TaxID=47874 RepID=A0A136PKQ8_9ACTN|nr:type III-B CRISPR module-associated protein Cmr5 [Micromonospora rosaria]KXK59005.1 hypothetical protein AWW66_26610 [Micromonospora rosaria]